jgi:O-antigen/teichoic acid export membrane protein
MRYWSSLTYTAINTIIGLLAVRFIYLNFPDLIDVYIIMTILRYEGIFSFLGSGLLNGALIYGQREEISEVNTLFIKRIGYVSLAMVLLVMILAMLSVKEIYVLSILSVPFAMSRAFYRNVLFSRKEFLKLNSVSLFFGIIFIGVLYNLDTIRAVAFLFLAIAIVESLSIFYLNGDKLQRAEPSSLVKENVKENLRQGLVSALFNNVDRFIFARYLPVESLLTVDFAHKVRTVLMKFVSSINNVWLPNLYSKSTTGKYALFTMYSTLFILVLIMGLTVYLDIISGVFGLNSLDQSLFFVLIAPTAFVSVLYKMRSMNAMTINLSRVTLYRVLEGGVRSIIVPLLVYLLPVVIGFKLGYLISLFLLGFGVIISSKSIKGSMDLILYTILIIYSICQLFVLL